MMKGVNIFITLIALYVSGNFQLIECFKLSENDYNQSRVAEFDRFGWQALERSEEPGESIYRNITIEIDNKIEEQQQSTTTTTTKKPYGAKLVDWDDDSYDFNEDSLALLLNGGKSLQKKKVLSLREKSTSSASSLRQSRKKNSFNRLIYHGQVPMTIPVVKQVVDGLEMHIRTHKPVIINRRSHASAGWSAASGTRWNPGLSIQTTTTTTTGPEIENTQPSIMVNNHILNDDNEQNNFLPTAATKIGTSIKEKLSNELISSTKRAQVIIGQQQSVGAAASDWRPILVSNIDTTLRQRRSGKISSKENSTNSSKEHRNEDNNNNNHLSLDSKWKPITKNNSTIKKLKIDGEQIGDNFQIHSIPNKLETIISNKKTIEIEEKKRKKTSSIESPFDDNDDDDDDEYSTINVDENNNFKTLNNSAALILQKREPKSISDKQRLNNDQQQQQQRQQQLSGENKFSSFDNKWKPLKVTMLQQNDNGNLKHLNSAAISNQNYLQVNSSRLNQQATISSNTLTPSTVNILSSNATNTSTSIEQQRSASSDLNYIYSSQPQQLVGSNPGASSSSYYTNYIVPQPQPAPELPIIDTTSGQTPEMIVDRTPIVDSTTNTDTPAAASGGYYSQPVVQATFQPALPVKQPPMQYYGGYGGGGHTGFESASPVVQSTQFVASAGNNYYTQPQAQSFRKRDQNYQPQQQQQPTRQQQAIPQVVKQEHHYHYYNNQNQATQQELSRQQQTTSNQQQQQSQTPTIIREIQPIMISSPIVQQQSTTQAPTQTIIREIVREVPMQQQLQPAARLVQLPQPQTTFVQLAQPIPIIAPPPPPPIQLTQVVRDLEQQDFTRANAYGSGGGGGGVAGVGQAVPAAQRIMRQLSNSLPQVAVRMPPSIAQFRLQMPAIQSPLTTLRNVAASGGGGSNAAPVTRQTGSFIIPPVPKKTTTYMTETQVMPTHTTIMQTTQFTPATRTTVFTTDHQQQQPTGEQQTRAIDNTGY